MFNWTKNPWWVAFESPIVFVVIMLVGAIFVVLAPKVSEHPTPPLPSALPAPAPTAAPSASNTETDKEIVELRKQLAELKETLKAGAGTKPESGTKSQTLGEWFASLPSRLPSPPTRTSESKTATLPPAPTTSAYGDTLNEKLTKSIEELKERLSKPHRTESKPVPPPPPTPSILPSPPAIRPATIAGPSGSSGGIFSGLFSGGCSARKQPVTLRTGEWYQLSEGGANECVVVLDWDWRNAVMIARDGKGKFELKQGVTRNPRQVMLVAGNGDIEYSTCDPRKVPPGTQLDFYCNGKSGTE